MTQMIHLKDSEADFDCETEEWGKRNDWTILYCPSQIFLKLVGIN